MSMGSHNNYDSHEKNELLHNGKFIFYLIYLLILACQKVVRLIASMEINIETQNKS